MSAQIRTDARPTGRARTVFYLPLLLIVAAALLSGCVIQGVEAQPPLDVGAAAVPSLAIAPVEGPPGTTVFVSGAGFDPDDTVYVNLVVIPEDEPLQATVAIATSDADGRFTASFDYPYDPVYAEPGEVAVVARSVGTGLEAASAFMVTEAEETPTPSVTPSPSPTVTVMPGTPTPTPQPSDIALVVSSALNVRSGPSTIFPVITTVRQGTPLRVLGQNRSGAWLSVRIPSGTEGWVARGYTSFTGSAPVVPSPNPPSPTAAPQPPQFTDWRGEYFNNMSVSGPPAQVRNDVAVNFDWGFGSPAPSIRNDFFSARWLRTEYFPGGTYRFFARSDDGVRIWVDGNLIIDQWHAATGETYSAVLNLSNGTHAIRVEYYEATQLASISVWWAAEGSYPQWRGAYFDNPNLAGSPVLVRNDSSIDFDWGLGSPAPGIPSDNFSVQWTRQVYFDAGTYRLYAEMDDGMRVWVDGTLVIDQWQEGGVRTVSKDIYLGQGDHNLRVDYFEAKQYAVAKFWWERIYDTPVPDSYPDWKGEYWTNQNLSGDPRVTRNDPSIDFNWGTGSPDDDIPDNHFSARWTRRYRFSEGTYRFYARSDDGVRVWVDGDRIIDEWQNNDGRVTYEADVWLDGRTDLRVEYYEDTGGAMIHVWWERISGTATPTTTSTVTATPTGSPTVTPTGTPSAFADVSPASGSGGTQVTVSGGNFPANTRINVYMGGLASSRASATSAEQVYATTVTDRTGAFSVGFTMPDTWPDGQEIQEGRIAILVATTDFAVEASAIFTYEAPRPTVAPAPYVQVAPRTGGPGTRVTVSGGGFAANTQVSAYLAGVAGVRGLSAAAAPSARATTTTDGNGNYSMQFTMPSSWPNGPAVETGKLMVVVATSGFNEQATTTFDYFVSAPKPTLRLSPATASGGTAVTASGAGFPASTVLNLYLASPDAQHGTGAETVYATTSTDVTGNYSMSFAAPRQWPDGTPIENTTLIVTVANRDFSVQISATLGFTPGATPTGTLTATPAPTQTPAGTPTPYPNASANPSSGGEGSSVSVSGSGFPATTSLGVYLAAFDKSGSPADDAVRFATASTNAQGQYQASFTLPGKWPDGSAIDAGPLLIVVATNDFGVQASAVFDYTGATSSGAEPAVPVTPATATASATPTATATATAAATRAPSETPQPVPTQEDTPIAEPTATELPATETPAATSTSVPPTEEVEPTETATSVVEATPTEEPSGTAAPTEIVAPTETAEPTATVEPPTAEPAPTEAATAEAPPSENTTEPATATAELPTATSEPPTNTPEPPTATAEPPTNTPEPPTATPEPPTNTPEPPTATPEPPTNTPEPPTATPEPPTSTPEPPTATPVPPTNTPEPPTNTPVVPTPTATPTPTLSLPAPAEPPIVPTAEAPGDGTD